MALLDPIESVMDDCDACETVHVGIVAVGRCGKCQAEIERSVYFSVMPEPVTDECC